MGVGLCAVAPVPQKGGRPLSKADCFAAVRAAIDAVITDPLERRMLDFGEHEHTLFAQLHPIAESLEFHWEPSGGKQPGARLTVMTKTSTVGPGYHAWVTGLVNEVGRRVGLAWDWSEDETEFSRSGDFAALQGTMEHQLRAMADAFLEHAGDGDEDGSFAVNMNMGFSAAGRPGEFSQTPLGPIDRAWWDAARREKDLPARCREFYMWWDRDRDAAYWRKLALALLWTEVPWHPPADEVEENTCRLALEALDRAITLDPKQRIPSAAMNELAEILELDPEEDELRPPDPGGIGYHRRTMRRHAPGGWSLEVPGYFFREWNEEEGQLSFWFGDRSTFISSYHIPPKDGKPIPAATLAADFAPDAPDDAERLEHADDGHIRHAVIVPYEEDDFRGRSLQGCIAADGQCAIVTVIYADDADREAAVETWQSVMHSGARADGDEP